MTSPNEASQPAKEDPWKGHCQESYRCRSGQCHCECADCFPLRQPSPAKDSREPYRVEPDTAWPPGAFCVRFNEYKYFGNLGKHDADLYCLYFNAAYQLGSATLQSRLDAAMKVVEAARHYQKLHVIAQAGVTSRAPVVADALIAQMELFDAIRAFDSSKLDDAKGAKHDA